MKTKTFAILFTLTCCAATSFAQKGPARLLGEPILTDTLSTLFIPTRYNEEFLSTNKIAYWNDYYANILVYNFKTDTYKKLFEKDTYIASLRNPYTYGAHANDKIDNLTPKWVFLLIKPTDTNKNGRIDARDPSVVFAVSPNGQEIKQLTTITENVLYIESFQQQGFMLIKLQRDTDNDGSFKTEDQDFYFRKITLADLSLGKGVEIQ